MTDIVLLYLSVSALLVIFSVFLWRPGVAFLVLGVVMWVCIILSGLLHQLTLPLAETRWALAGGIEFAKAGWVISLLLIFLAGLMTIAGFINLGKTYSQLTTTPPPSRK